MSKPRLSPLAFPMISMPDDDQLAVQEFQDSIERELALSEPSHDHQAKSPPAVAAYEEPDYADYEPDASYADGEAGEGIAPAGHAEAVAPRYEERPAVAAPSLSLEDELETLLAGSAQPVVQRSANASWGYGSQTQVAGRTEPAPSISRTTSLSAAIRCAGTEVTPGCRGARNQQLMKLTEEQVQDSAHEDFDTEELMAAFDDFDVSADSDE